MPCKRWLRTILLLEILTVCLPARQFQAVESDSLRSKINPSVMVVAVRCRIPPEPGYFARLGQENRSKADIEWKRSLKELMSLPSIRNIPEVNLEGLNAGIDGLRLASSPLSTTVLERPAPPYQFLGPADTDLQRRLESEFLRRKRFPIVHSREEADLIFFMESRYVPYFKNVIRGPAMSGYNIVSLQGDGQSYDTMVVERNALVLPAAAYPKDRTEFPSLDSSLLWQGNRYANNHDQAIQAEPSPEDLVRRFHQFWEKREKGSKRAEGRQASSGSLPNTFPRQKSLSTDVEPMSPSMVPTPKEAVSRPSESLRIRSEVVLVNALARVLDSTGQDLVDLLPEEFHLYEDGVEQTIRHFRSTETPFYIALLFDTSESMQPRMADMQPTALAFTDLLRRQDWAMVASSNHRLLIETEFTEDPARMKQAIRQIHPGRGTRLYDSLDLTITERLSKMDGRKAILLFSDGIDTASRLTDRAEVLRLVEESDVKIFCLEYRPEIVLPIHKYWSSYMAGTAWKQIQNKIPEELMRQEEEYGRRFLADLAEKSGGRSFQAESAKDLCVCLDVIAQELRQQYSLGYYPRRPPEDGSFRKIVVRVDRPGAKVLTRAGYRIPKEKKQPASPAEARYGRIPD